MLDMDFFTLETPRFRIEGRSRSGHETFFRIRELGIALDLGRCPDLIVSAPQVFITHAHVDHCAGMAFYAAQRHLQRMPLGRLYVPEEAADGISLSRWQRRKFAEPGTTSNGSAAINSARSAAVSRCRCA